MRATLSSVPDGYAKPLNQKDLLLGNGSDICKLGAWLSPSFAEVQFPHPENGANNTLPAAIGHSTV